MSKVKTDRQGFVAGILCDCGGRLGLHGATRNYICIRCCAVTTAAKLFLKLNTPVVH
jgi:hypothetical protein